MRICGFADFVKTKDKVKIGKPCPACNNQFSQGRVDVEIIFVAEIISGEFAEIHFVKYCLVGVGKESEMDNER